MKTKILILTFAAFVMMSLGSVYALPQDPRVENGNVSVDTPNSSTMNITASDKAIVNFVSFNIAQNETVNFIQPSANASCLSRVTGPDPSVIAGSLSANGILLLINTNGINFTPTANVQVNTLVASTLDISNTNFINGNYELMRNQNSNYSQILNEGTISGANIALIGSAVENRGIITASAGTVHLSAGDKTVVTFDSRGFINVEVTEATSGMVIDKDGNTVKDAIRNSGTIQAHQVFMTARTAQDIFEHAVNNTGIIRATKLVNENGIIKVVAEGAPVKMAGTIEADSIMIEAPSQSVELDGSILENITALSPNVTIYQNTPNMHIDNMMTLDNLTTIEGDNLKVTYLKDSNVTLKTDGLLDTNPAVILSAPTLTLIATQFGTANNSLNVNAANLNIQKTTGDINIVQSTGIGTSILICGPPDGGFGSILYNSDTNLTLDAQNGSISESKGVSISAQNLTLTASQNIDISGTLKGNSVYLLGNQVKLTGAQIDVSGVSGGGTVLIGGDFQGKGAVTNAANTYVSRDSYIYADATGLGNGGRVIVWSDESTLYYGHISARGGPEGGNGGFVQVSGAKYLTFNGFVDAAAPVGNRGTFILAPYGTSGYAASLATDLTDYAPGQVVTITGSGYQPGETVSIILHPGKDTLQDITLTATADSNGSFSNSSFSTRETAMRAKLRLSGF